MKAESKRGMVVAAHPVAARAGADVLSEGGNSVEAAVAVSLALEVVEPFASGLGGGGFMMVCPRGRIEDTVVIDSRSVVPSLFTPERLHPRGRALPWTPKSGPMSAGVPGLGRALDYALRTYGGRLPLSRLVEPAIRAAEEGFEVSETYRYCAGLFEATLRHFPETCAIFLKDGCLPPVGHRIRQPDLAWTFRRIAEQGFEDLYTGELARRMLAAVNRSGPVWGEKDLEHYRIEVRRPLRASVLGVDLLTTPPPSVGGLGILATLRAWDPKRPGFHSPEHILLLWETWKVLWNDLEGVGDPAYVRAPDSVYRQAGVAAPGSASTTHYVIVDAEGTVVSASQTIQHFFGSGMVVPGAGILINDDLTDMSPRPGTATSIEPGRRAMANMAPTIAALSGRPLLALGTPGSHRIFPVLSQVICNVIGYGMDLEEALEAPRVHWEKGTGFLEGGIPPRVIEEVRARAGCPVTVTPKHDLFFGGVHAAMVRGDGTIEGAADPRRDGVAIGV